MTTKKLTNEQERELSKQKQKLLDAKIDAFISDSEDDLVLLFSYLRRLKVKRDKDVNGHSNDQFVALCRECISAAANTTQV